MYPVFVFFFFMLATEANFFFVLTVENFIIGDCLAQPILNILLHIYITKTPVFSRLLISYLFISL